MPVSAKQETVALALASGRTVAEAAAEHHCGERTIRRWLAEVDGFRQRVQELRTELFSLTVGRLSELSVKAAEALGELLDSQTEGVRLQAARSILEHGPKLREATDLAGQVEEFRRLVEEGRQRGEKPPQRNGQASADRGQSAGPG
jgi:hypothetical protein